MSYRVIGIDPALTATGLCVLESVRPQDYRVTAKTTIKTHSKQPMLDRLRAIHAGVGGFLSDIDMQPRGHLHLHAIIEDPTGQVRVHRGKNPRSIAVMGLAVGVVVSAAMDYCAEVDFIDTDDWMMKEKSGNLEHIMAHGMMTRMLMGLIKFAEEPTEHEVMAAGVARWWIEQDRRSQRMRIGA